MFVLNLRDLVFPCYFSDKGGMKVSAHELTIRECTKTETILEISRSVMPVLMNTYL